MNNSSLAAQAVVMGPQSAAPPSFDGHGWLVVGNLGLFTAGCIIGAMFVCEQVRHLWRNRKRDAWGHPVTIWRLILLGLFAAMTLRCGAAAAVLWRWSPADPVGSGWVLTMQRFLDPVALAIGLASLAAAVLASPGIVTQLRRTPPPDRREMWLAVPQLKRPAMVAAMSLIAAIGVVSTR